MKIVKKIFMYLIVVIAVLLIGFLFMKIFKFDKKTNIEYPEISEEKIAEMYKLFPKKNYNPGASFYTGSYLTSSNVGYSTKSLVAYNYIERTHAFKFEKITKEDASLLSEYKLLYKIDKEYFKKMVTYIFGESNYYILDFKIDETKSAKVKDEYKYVYIYETNNEIDNDIIYYKGLESYTVENGNESIKIIEYFLKCNKTTRVCYNDESNNQVSNITYSENLNIKDNMDKVKKYEHKFSYINNHYEYVSTRVV